MADPDIAKANGMIVVLQSQRKFFGVRFVRLASDGGTLNFDVVLHQNPVVKNGDAPEMEQFAVRVEF